TDKQPLRLRSNSFRVRFCSVSLLPLLIRYRWHSHSARAAINLWFRARRNGFGKTHCLRGITSLGSHLLMQMTERLLVGMELLSEQPMAAPVGLVREVGPASFFMAFPLPTQIMGRLWVKMALFSEQQMGGLGGFTRQVGQSIFFGAFPLP